MTVRDGRIAGLGRPAGRPWPLPPGAVVVPGFEDPHVHLLAMAAARVSIDCGPVAAPTQAALACVLDDAARRGTGWLRGVGFDEALVAERRPPGRARLDAAVPDRPVVVHAAAGTVAYANTVALRLLGVDPDVDDATPGVERDATGAATGEVSKRTSLLDRVPALPPLALDAGLVEVARVLAGAGITAVTDATATNGPADLARLAAWAGGGGAPRVTAMVGAARLVVGMVEIEAPPELSVRHAKIVVEGADPVALDDLVGAARRSGFAVALHVTDIDALDRALASLAATPTPPRPGRPGGVGSRRRRHVPDRLEHVSLSLPEQAGAIARAKVAVVTQPAFMAVRGVKYAEQLSPVEREWLYRARSLLGAGVLVAASSDAPVVAAAPLRSMAAAMVALNPSERVGPMEALQMVTANAARVSGTGGGVLRDGGPADLVVLGADPLRVPPADVGNIPVLATISGGRIVHSAPELGW